MKAPRHNWTLPELKQMVELAKTMRIADLAAVYQRQPSTIYQTLRKARKLVRT